MIKDNLLVFTNGDLHTYAISTRFSFVISKANTFFHENVYSLMPIIVVDFAF